MEYKKKKNLDQTVGDLNNWCQKKEITNGEKLKIIADRIQTIHFPLNNVSCFFVFFVDEIKSPYMHE